MSTVTEINREQSRLDDTAAKLDSNNDLSHDALANRVSAQRFKGDALYVESWHSWLFWNGARWKVAEQLEHMTAIRGFLRDVAATVPEPKLARELRSDSMRAAVERMVRSNPEVTATAGQWDADPWLLGTPGGTVDLRTGKIREARRADYITRQASVAPADKDAPRWREFLERIFRSTPELLPFLQRAAGYALTGQTTEHKLLFAFGTGRNGKGVFFNTLAGILGDYSTVAASATFLDSGADQHPTDLASLAGARLVTASELPPGKAWNEARIKSMTGGDPITARRMRQDFFTYDPQFTLMIAGNHLPSFRGIDEATRARVLLIPFAEVIPAQERDPDLADKLRAEWPAILQWAIEGALQWQEQGLCAPESVEAASAEYLESEDLLGEFITERLQGAPDGFISTRELYDAFREWCDARGMRSPWTQHALTRALTERGLPLPRRNTGRGLLGYALKQGGAKNYGTAKWGE